MCQGITFMYYPLLLQWSVFLELAQTHWTDINTIFVFCMLFKFLLTIVIPYHHIVHLENKNPDVRLLLT